MIALYIIAGFLLLFALVMLVKIQIFFCYDNSPVLKLKILFVTVVLVPREKKKSRSKHTDKKLKNKKKSRDDSKTENKKQNKKNKPSYLSKMKNQKGISGILAILSELVKIVTHTSKRLLSHVIVSRFDIDISVVGEDAADTALKYGKLCGAVYPSVSIVCSATVCEDYNVCVTPNFDDDATSKIKCDINCHIRVGYIVWHLIYAALRLVVLKLKR